MHYPVVLFDLDHTLLDSASSETMAFAATLASIGIEDPAPYWPGYDSINKALWQRVEIGEIMPGHVKVTRWEQFVGGTDLKGNPRELADHFVAGLGANGGLYDGALATLETLTAAGVTLGLVTNGLGEVQRSRIARLELDQHFAAITISGEIGAAKPGTDIFDQAFTALEDPDKDTILMVGDSLSSDIQGGVNAGIATCWYNPNGRPTPQDAPAFTHSVQSLDELPELILGG